MDLEKNFQKSIDLFLNSYGILFLASLIVLVLSVISLGILAGPLFGGLIILNLKLLRNKPVEIKEVFNHFDKWVPTLLVFLASGILSIIIGHLPVIGFFANIIVSPFLLVISTIAIILIIEKNLEPVPAIKEGIAFLKRDPVIIWIYGLVTLVLAGIGAIVFGIGIVLTMPFASICMAVAYQEFSEKGYFDISGPNHPQDQI